MYDVSKDLFCEECILKRFKYKEIEQNMEITNFLCSSCGNGKLHAKIVCENCDLPIGSFFLPKIIKRSEDRFKGQNYMLWRVFLIHHKIF